LQVISTKHLLYIKTASSNHIETDCVFLNYNYHLPISVNKLIAYYAKLHLKTPELQIETAKKPTEY